MCGASNLCVPMSRGQTSSDDATSTIASSLTGDSSAQQPLEETAARASKESPCRTFHPLTFPRDWHEPHEEALGSHDFPPKRVVTEWGGVDAMGPWLRPHSDDMLLLSQRTVHMNPGCSLITRGTFSLDLCYCVDKLHRCFHYEVDNNFGLHTSSRCSENVDIAMGQKWPVVVMCRRCCPFPESLR